VLVASKFHSDGQWQQQQQPLLLLLLLLLPLNLKLAYLPAHLMPGWLSLHAVATGCMLPHLQNGSVLLG
jgi:hypothetical protein